MEVQYSLCTTLVLLIITTLLYYKAKNQSSPKNLPPGPTKLPIIGNLHNLIGSSLPHRTLTDLSRKYGPLMHLKLGEVPTLIVSSPDMAKEFMRTHDLSFADRPESFAVKITKFARNGISFSPFGVYFREMKMVCVTELLSRKRVQSFSSLREAEIGNLVETIRSSSSPINLLQRLLETTSMIISRASFGRKYDSVEVSALRSAIKEASLIGGGFSLPDLFPSISIFQVLSPVRSEFERIAKKMDNALENIILKHMSEEIGEETEDFVDVLLRVQKSCSLEIPIARSNIKSIILDMFGGGTNTTATTVDWAMAEMMKNPRVMRKAQSEIREVLKGKTTIHESDIRTLTYLKLVIKETFRLHPNVPLLLPRECREPCVIDGFEIPMKTQVLINAWAIGRDKTFWGIDADTFVPERFLDNSVDFMGTNFEFIPFGSGRRMCPGILFGVANVEFFLSQLLYHFDWHLPVGMKPEDLDMTEHFGSSVGRKFNLHFTTSPFVPEFAE